MKQLVLLNRKAIQAIAFFVTPIGILILIGICIMLESIGIALFYSGLFLDKVVIYYGKLSGTQPPMLLASAISLSIGALLSMIILFGALVLRLIGQTLYAKVVSIVFFVLASSTYFDAFGIQSVDITKIIGILLMVLIPALLVHVFSLHLSKEVVKSGSFKQMQDAIFEKSTQTAKPTKEPKSSLEFYQHLN